MKTYAKTPMISFATAMILAISGCGGSSSTSEDTTNKEDSVKQSVITTSGKAVDGYLVYATVCLDLNLDGYCQIGDEPATSTDENGSFSLEISTQQQQHKNYKTAPLLVYGGYDADTRVDFSGKLKAPFETSGTLNITPITTMVATLIKNGQTKAEAQTSVKNMLDLNSTTNLNADPIALATKDSGADSKLLKAALKLQKSIEVMAQALQKQDTQSKTEDLVSNIYDSFAQNIKTKTDKLDAILEKVATAKNLPKNTKDGIVAVSKQIDGLFKDSITSTAVIGTKIDQVKRKIKTEIIDNNKSLDSIGLNSLFSGNNDFRLLHAKEILHITNYKDADFETVASEIKDLLINAGMPEDRFLPLSDEIDALKNSSNLVIKNIANKFESMFTNHKQTVSEIVKTKNVKPISLEMIKGKTFYLTTKPLSGSPYISKVTFHEDGTRDFSKNGKELPSANYEIKNNKLHVYNNNLNIYLKTIPLPTLHGDAILALAMFNKDGKKIATRLVFKTKEARDEFVKIKTLHNVISAKTVYETYYTTNDNGDKLGSINKLTFVSNSKVNIKGLYGESKDETVNMDIKISKNIMLSSLDSNGKAHTKSVFIKAIEQNMIAKALYYELDDDNTTFVKNSIDYYFTTYENAKKFLDDLNATEAPKDENSN